MVFSSFFFIFFFLPAALAAYYLTPSRFKNLALVLISIFFYAWGAPKFLVLFLISCLLDYILVRALFLSAANQPRQKLVLAVSIVLNVGLLLYFKYANFFIAQTSAILSALGFQSLSWIKVVLPIGISFFTFHKISYTIDVFRGKSKPTKSFVDYLLYISFFPQLIAGPIVRYHEIDQQILQRRHSWANAYYGIGRFVFGLSKKILIADPLAAVADHAFGLKLGGLTGSYAWIGLLAYALQIYFDFSGYSDMAIGLARMFGFYFPENFNKPYISGSFTEFWRRWHISLSRWMRDYLYIPLGGNRGSSRRTYLNLGVVFLLSGFWHGAQWTFILWGIYHGFFLVIERLGFEKILERCPYLLRRSYALLFIFFGWVLFRADSLTKAVNYYRALLAPWTLPHINIPTPASVISSHGLAVLTFGVFYCLVLELDSLSAVRQKIAAKFTAPGGLVLQSAAIFLLFIFCVLFIESTNFSPFIYFQF